jgi:hypothetical protein
MSGYRSRSVATSRPVPGWMVHPSSWVLPLVLVLGADVAMAGVQGIASRLLITTACLMALAAYLLGPQAMAAAVPAD